MDYGLRIREKDIKKRLPYKKRQPPNRYQSEHGPTCVPWIVLLFCDDKEVVLLATLCKDVFPVEQERSVDFHLRVFHLLLVD